MIWINIEEKEQLCERVSNILTVFLFLFTLHFSGRMKKQEHVRQSDEPVTVTVRSTEHFSIF